MPWLYYFLFEQPASRIIRYNLLQLAKVLARVLQKKCWPLKKRLTFKVLNGRLQISFFVISPWIPYNFDSNSKLSLKILRSIASADDITNNLLKWIEKKYDSLQQFTGAKKFQCFGTIIGITKHQIFMNNEVRKFTDKQREVFGHSS